MAWNLIKPTGASKASTPESGGANARFAPILGIVKDNIDPIRAGRLQVYLSDFGGKDSDDATNWTTVSYMSPFFGATKPTGAKDGYGEYLKNPSSYGMWNSPPDIGSVVICIFMNGDPTFGFYIGCVPDAETLFMVPAIGCADNYLENPDEPSHLYNGAPRLPVANLNTNNKPIVDSSGFLKDKRPIHSFAALAILEQGLHRDPVRGVIGSSAQRESPSRVGFGVSTPGRPLSETPVTRQSGHSFVMDDGDSKGKDQLIRIRTALGHQILMSDDGECLMVIHANGKTWVELGKEGTIDMYAETSVNIRTQGDMNFHSDKNINMYAKESFNVSANDIHTESEAETTARVGADFKHSTSGSHTVKVDGGMSMDSSGEASYASSSTTYINGSRINLNTGATSLSPSTVEPIEITDHPETEYKGPDDGWVSEDGKLQSIVSRAPTHKPFAENGEPI
jgi:hypothetical protein